LDTDLDITSLKILASSHEFVPSFEEGRVLTFTFNDILLPDSTTDLLGSQGFISFSIKPRSGIMIGDVMENTAGIYFDFNPAIITNTVTHVVEMSTGIVTDAGRLIRLAPNPVSDVLFVMDVQDAQGRVEVRAADGRKVPIPVVRSGSTLQLDVHSLAPGLYILRTVNGTARFVKN
ncbi:MAG: T9SS type A sorting domain-containing protein, partial [Flavobacteriales bacterium]